jgi:hypothetical protein
VNDGARTCYLCCPSAAYVDYAKAELDLLGASAALRLAAHPFLAAGGRLIAAAGLDRQVQCNNWLLSTNPPPPAVGSLALRDLTECLTADWPDHALAWRSLNAPTSDALLASLRALGWLSVPARVVYHFDCRQLAPRVGRDEARDRALRDASPYRLVDATSFAPDDFERAATLYGLLYLQKYTPLNPHYTGRCLSRLVGAGLIELKGLRAPQGQLDGMIAFFDAGDVMTAPMVGYDTSLPQALGLYRMLMNLGFDRARRRRLLFNVSAGADAFKRNRGARPVVEYSTFYVRHLAWPNRVAGHLLASLLNRLAPAFFDRLVA